MILLNAFKSQYAISVESCTALLLLTYADKTPNEHIEYVISVPLAREEILSSIADTSTTRALQATQVGRQPRTRTYNDRGWRENREYRQQRGGRVNRGGRDGERNSPRTEERASCWTCSSANDHSSSCPLNRGMNEPTTSGRNNMAASAMTSDATALEDQLATIVLAIQRLEQRNSTALASVHKGMICKIMTWILDSECTQHMSPDIT